MKHIEKLLLSIIMLLYTLSVSYAFQYYYFTEKRVNAGLVIELPSPLVVNATIDINPKTLNLRGSYGKWITAYIELPEGFNVQEINVSTILLNDTISAELKPTAIGDYDNDTIPDLMVKFDRQRVINYIMSHVDLARLYEEGFMEITLTITGHLYDGTPFQGIDTIKIIMPTPRGLYKTFPI